MADPPTVPSSGPANDPTSRPVHGTSRRSLLKLLGGGAAGAALGASATLVAGDLLRPSTAPATVTPPPPPPLRFFNDAQAKTITAMAERIFLKDAAGPGATDAHVVNYIDGRL